MPVSLSFPLLWLSFPKKGKKRRKVLLLLSFLIVGCFFFYMMNFRHIVQTLQQAQQQHETNHPMNSEINNNNFDKNHNPMDIVKRQRQRQQQEESQQPPPSFSSETQKESSILLGKKATARTKAQTTSVRLNDHLKLSDINTIDSINTTTEFYNNSNNTNTNNITLQIPTPIFLASLPKSGTTSVWKYFTCGGIRACHHFVKLNDTQQIERFENSSSTYAGRCIHSNILLQRPMLEGCGNYDVWTDTGYIKGKPAVSCYYPAIDGLHEFYKSYPNATLMYITRNTQSWTKSVSMWSMGTLLKRWKRCHLTGLLKITTQEQQATVTTTDSNTNDTTSNKNDNNSKILYNTSKAGMNAFYEWHKSLVRNFAKNHPSLTYIEASLEDPFTGFVLQNVTGIPASCWADCNPKTRMCTTTTTNT